MVTPGRKAPGRAAVCLALAAWSLVALSGCSRLTAGHLEARAATAGTRETLTMKFWTFGFTVMPAGARQGVKGAASPRLEALPPFADTIQELTLYCYLRDASGRVLASDEKRFLPMSLSEAAAVPFDFFLSPPEGAAGRDLSISFGYRGVYAAKAGTPGGQVFFAGEGALVEY